MASDPSDLQAPAPLSGIVEIAPFPGRVLAGIVDWVALTALFVSFSRFVPNPDWTFLITLLFGFAYFTLCHTAFSGGQTLGKRAFGLRLVSAAHGSPVLIGPARAAARYLLFLGAIVIARDVPPVLYRMNELTAAPQLLELPMLFVLAYFAANVFALAFDAHHRTLYDRIVGTVAVRCERVPDRADVDLLLSGPVPPLLRRPAGYAPVGLVVGGMLWFFSVTAHPDLLPIIESRYVLENRFNMRIVSAGIEQEQITVRLVKLDPARSSTELVREIAADAVTRAPRLREKLKRIEVTVFVQSQEQPETFTVPLDSLVVEKVEPKAGAR